jgi:hypothetical protein
LCVPISASICKQHRMSFSLSFYLSHTVKPIGAGIDAQKIRDQVSTCVCLFRFLARDIHIAQLPRGNLSKVESLSLYKSIFIACLYIFKRARKRKGHKTTFFSPSLNDDELSRLSVLGLFIYVRFLFLVNKQR